MIDRTEIDRMRAIALVAAHYDLPLRLILSASRARKLVQVRQRAAFLLHNVGLGTLSEIGTSLGGLDGSSVKYSIDKVQAEAVAEPDFANELSGLDRIIKDSICGTTGPERLQEIATSVLAGAKIDDGALRALAASYLEHAA